jgi:hypothetical protein
MSDLLFNTPWWLPSIIALVGIVLFIAGNRRGHDPARNTGGALILAAVALICISYFVKTQKEKCVAQARSLIQAVEKRDVPAMKRLLGPNTAVNGLLVGPDQIIPAAQSGAEAYHLESLSVISTDVQRVQTVITVSMTVFAQSKDIQPTRVDCQFQWNQSADGWHLQNIDLTNIGGQNPDDLLKRISPFR